MLNKFKMFKWQLRFLAERMNKDKLEEGSKAMNPNTVSYILRSVISKAALLADRNVDIGRLCKTQN